MCSTALFSSNSMYISLFIEQIQLIFLMHCFTHYLLFICVDIQLSVDLNGPDGTLSLRARGVDPAVDHVSCVFTGEGVETLMDLSWHKVAISVQQEAASLHVDCNSIETKPLEPRGDLPTDGHTLLGIRASDAGPMQVWICGELGKKTLKLEEDLCELLIKHAV